MVGVKGTSGDVRVAQFELRSLRLFKPVTKNLQNNKADSEQYGR